MEEKIIRLNKKKKTKKILWKRVILFIIICAITTMGVIFNSYFCISYRYYQKIDNKYEMIGASPQKNLGDAAAIEMIKDIKSDGFEISYYKNKNKIYSIWSIVKKTSPDKTEQIKQIYKDNIEFYVYALSIDFNGKRYLLPSKEGRKILNLLNEQKNDKIKVSSVYGTYTNFKNILSQEEINELMASLDSSFDIF